MTPQREREMLGLVERLAAYGRPCWPSVATMRHRVRVAEIVANSPPITDETRQRIAELMVFGGGRR